MKTPEMTAVQEREAKRLIDKMVAKAHRIMKTPEQIDAMISKLRAEIDRLPERDVFGDSNAESITELKIYILALEAAKGGYWLDSEVENWVTESQFSALSDYE